MLEYQSAIISFPQASVLNVNTWDPGSYLKVVAQWVFQRCLHLKRIRSRLSPDLESFPDGATIVKELRMQQSADLQLWQRK